MDPLPSKSSSSGWNFVSVRQLGVMLYIQRESILTKWPIDVRQLGNACVQNATVFQSYFELNNIIS
jgi:hypothetical protein